MRISDWSSDVCSSDLVALLLLEGAGEHVGRIVVVAGKPVLPGAHDAAGRVEQAVAGGVVARPSEERPDGGLRLLPARAFDLAGRLQMSALEVEGKIGRAPRLNSSH